MTEANKSVQEQDLHAYVDGQLDANRVKEVEAYLLENPGEAQRMAEYKQLNQLLQQQHRRIIDEPVPDRLLSAPTPKKRAVSIPFLMAASVLWGIVGGVVGWSIQAASNTPASMAASLAKPAMYAHVVYIPEVVHPVEVTADQEQHLVKWLSKRMGHDVQAPNLNQHGYGLIGGRLLPDEGKAAAQFMYENKDGNRLTLYVRQNNNGFANTSFQFAQTGGVSAFYWVSGELGYALSGNVEKNTLFSIATTVYQFLES